MDKKLRTVDPKTLRNVTGGANGWNSWSQDSRPAAASTGWSNPSWNWNR